MGNKLYVGNLSFNSTEAELSAHLGAFGTVQSCKIITDRDTGRSKGFGFVEMASNEEAQAAIESLDGQEFDGRNLRINESKPQEKRNTRSRW